MLPGEKITQIQRDRPEILAKNEDKENKEHKKIYTEIIEAFTTLKEYLKEKVNLEKKGDEQSSVTAKQDGSNSDRKRAADMSEKQNKSIQEERRVLLKWLKEKKGWTLPEPLIEFFSSPRSESTTSEECFLDAYEIYNLVSVSDAKTAFFYKLRDRRAILLQYSNLYPKLIDTLKKEIIGLGSNDRQFLVKNVEDIINKKCTEYYSIECLKEVPREIYEIRARLITNISTNFVEWYTTCGYTVNTLIDNKNYVEIFNIGLLSQEKIEELGDLHFFGVTDPKNSRKKGQIYNPMMPHTYAKNIVWVFALIEKGFTIVLKSSIKHRNRHRSSQQRLNLQSNKPMPSAIALELAIVIKAGYICQVTDPPKCEIRLVPGKCNSYQIPTVEEQFDCHDTFTILRQTIECWKAGKGPDPRGMTFSKGQIKLEITKNTERNVDKVQPEHKHSGGQPIFFTFPNNLPSGLQPGPQIVPEQPSAGPQQPSVQKL